jgi:hypothetical protein
MVRLIGQRMFMAFLKVLGRYRDAKRQYKAELRAEKWRRSQEHL